MDNEMLEPVLEPVKDENSGKSAYLTIQGLVYEWIDAAVISMIAVVFIFTFIFSIVGISGSSMRDTLQDKDIVILSRLFYTPKYGDIVVISRNYANDENIIASSDNKPIIKRVIATEGQTVDIKDGSVYIDGVKQNEPYTRTETRITEDVKFPVTVPHGTIFAMGDNRNDSHDSRSTQIGMVDTRYILGQAVFRVFPFDKIQSLEKIGK